LAKRRIGGPFSTTKKERSETTIAWRVTEKAREDFFLYPLFDVGAVSASGRMITSRGLIKRIETIGGGEA